MFKNKIKNYGNGAKFGKFNNLYFGTLPFPRTENPQNLPQVFLQNLPSLIPFFQIVLHKYQKAAVSPRGQTWPPTVTRASGQPGARTPASRR